MSFIVQNFKKWYNENYSLTSISSRAVTEAKAQLTS